MMIWSKFLKLYVIVIGKIKNNNFLRRRHELLLIYSGLTDFSIKKKKNNVGISEI